MGFSCARPNNRVTATTPLVEGEAHPMTFAATLQRRSRIFIASILAATAVFVPLQAARTAMQQHVVPAQLVPTTQPARAVLPASGRAHVDPALQGLHGTVRVIIQTTSTRSAALAVAKAGGTVTRALPIAHAFSATIPAAAIPTLATVPSIRTISLDAKIHMMGAPDPSKVKSVYPDAVNADKMWQSGYSGNGVTVALIDTGIANAPDLAGRVIPVTTDPLNLTSAPCANFSGESNCNDSYGHGTFIAGIIAGSGASSNGQYPGMAPNVNLISVKIAGANGATDVSNVLAALQWVVSFRSRYNIKVVNLSLGTNGTQSYRTDPFDYAVEQAWEAGITVVVSAGNAGPNPGTISKPADDPFVITVGAVDDNGTPGLGDDFIPNFSARGPTAADGIVKPDVVAPGTHIVSLRSPGSTIDQNFPHMDAYYHKGSGTSQAAGVVSGAVALLLQSRPTWTPDRIKFALTSTAHNVASTNPNDVGSGEIDVSAARNAASGLANQGIPQSDGTGSLDLSRGTVQFQTNDPAGTILSGAETAQLLLFSQLIYVTGPWNELTWWGGQWTGGQWYGGQWTGGQWTGGQWTGGQWYGQPEGGQWYGGQWTGGQWYGSYE
jgi:serine protease AprX